MESFAVDPDVFWWIAATALIIVGVIGTVLPMLPGTLLVLGGIVLGAWIDGFVRVSGATVAFIALLAVLAWVTDYVAALLGAKKAGASPLALVGAAVGTVLGILMGLVGLLFMPLLGAMAGEYWTQHKLMGRGATGAQTRIAGRKATKVGIATWIGLLLGTVVKLALTFLMIGVFVVALLW
ncbi:MAG: DUF456 domain-containing protein [Rhizobacter sp.]|nr:DUF456 domain-containing protein [Rhizobacter sp.]